MPPHNSSDRRAHEESELSSHFPLAAHLKQVAMGAVSCLQLLRGFVGKYFVRDRAAFAIVDR
jgi:hypothetical protein